MTRAELSLAVAPDPDDVAAATVLVDGAAGGHAYRFVLDSGAATTRLPHDPFTAALPRLGPHRTAGIAGTSDGDLVGPVDLTLGPLTVPGLRVAREARGAPPLLGRDVLARHACRLDLAARTLVLAPSGTLPAGLPLATGTKGHWFVDVAWPGTPDAGTGRACWDSGAGVTLVDLTFAQARPQVFVPAGASSTGTDASGATVTGTAYAMCGAVVGGVALPPHPVVATGLPRDLPAADRFDLLLGFSTLRLTAWTFDALAGRWDVDRPVDNRIDGAPSG